ncbi:YeeE/YedE thiosulfate transporter family protein [Hansschlegelia sp.]|uniref:YeeE/YedE thiosulfate transporter family protein n=1 Tax=Hansschlegelia sp. TaxID=2041892 RepID=UPI002BDB1461|nr:YeeE/YedE thiosulfate transporter family protein [Hansschlegelia sp.]HVI28546.1 YeeE/YedE thiosulfate transporter family protein [Hansschlegelia sp.]
MTRPLLPKHLSVPRPRAAGLVILAVLVATAALAFHDGGLLPRAWALAAGIVFGIALQRGELSLVRAWRDLLILGDSGQLLGFLAALAVAASLTLGGLALAGHAAPPEAARIGPVSWLLPVAGLVFGVGAVIARGGVMVHMRRLSEGSLVAAPALLAIFVGFIAGLATWPWAYRTAIASAPSPWLPDIFGLAPTLALEIAALGLCAAALWRWRPRRDAPGRTLAVRVLVEPWPGAAAGAVLGGLVAASYAVGEPLGLIGECAATARWVGAGLGLLPDALPGLDDGIAGFELPPAGFGLTGDVLVLFGFLAGAFAAALASGRFAPATATFRDVVEMVAGGLLVGWGAMTALGGLTGEAVAGVAVGAASGWCFFVFASLGVALALQFDRRAPVTHPEPATEAPPEDAPDPFAP